MRVGVTPLRARYARTARAGACDSRVFTVADPVLSVYPAISMRISGLSISDCATTSSTAYDSGRSAELPVWKVTPFNTTVGRRGGAPGAAGTRSSGKSSGQPYLSTAVCGGVLGQRSRLSGTPSPSLSRVTGQPVASTGVAGGVLGH